MTERLSATGKNMLERGRRLTSLPPSASFPRAYARLLLDPAERLDAACAGAMTSAPDAFAAEASEQFVEQGASAWRRTPASAFSHPAHGAAGAKPTSTRVSAPGDRAPLSPTPHAASHTARRVGPSSSSAPLRPSGDSGVRTPSPQTPAADVSSHDSFTSPGRPPTVNGPSKNIRVAAPPGAFARRGLDEATDSKIALRGPAPSETSPSVSEPVGVPPSPTRPFRVTTAPRRSSPLHTVAPHTSRANATGTSGDGERINARTSSASRADSSLREDERAPSSGLHFAQSPSRLASVLGANLASTEHAPGGLPAATEQDVPATRAESPRRLAPEETDAWAATDAEAREAGGVSVESLMEELYERLRLEFLRTYGTSGE